MSAGQCNSLMGKSKAPENAPAPCSPRALRTAGIGLFNIIYWQPSILKAFSPTFWFMFLVRNGNAGWVKLGGVVLCITGAPPPSAAHHVGRHVVSVVCWSQHAGCGERGAAYHAWVPGADASQRVRAQSTWMQGARRPLVFIITRTHE